MEQINEEWRDIDGYEGLYEVSNLGRVRSLDRIDRLGRLKPGVIKKSRMNPNGYLQVDLCKKGKQNTLYVHRLVAHAFIPNPEGLLEINHRDEDKTNNLVDNLEYCDRKYNVNYGTGTERMVQSRIRNGNADSELCGIGDENEYHRLYYQKNQEKIREYNQNNREKKLEYLREYHQKNREKILEQQREYRQKNREKVNERERLRYQKNREQINERRREQRLKKKQSSEESLW